MSSGPESSERLSRRHLLSRGTAGIGTAALVSLLGADGVIRGDVFEPSAVVHRPARAKNVVYIFQAGGPAQMELWDYNRDCATITARTCRHR